MSSQTPHQSMFSVSKFQKMPVADSTFEL